MTMQYPVISIIPYETVREETPIVIEKGKIKHIRIQRTRLSHEEQVKRKHEYYLKNQDRIKQRSYLFYHTLSEEQKREHIKSRGEYAKERFLTQIKGTPKHIIMKEK